MRTSRHQTTAACSSPTTPRKACGARSAGPSSRCMLFGNAQTQPSCQARSCGARRSTTTMTQRFGTSTASQHCTRRR